MYPCTHAYIHMWACVCVCVHSKQGHWCMGGHSKHLRRRIQLCTHTHTHTCMDSITRTHTRMHAYMYIDNSAAGELSKSDQRLYICACAVRTYTNMYMYINLRSCACVRFHLLCALCLLCFLSFANVQKTQDIFIWAVEMCKTKTHLFIYIIEDSFLPKETHTHRCTSTADTHTYTPTRRHMMHCGGSSGQEWTT